MEGRASGSARRMAAGTAMSAFGAFQQGQAQAAAAEYNARLADVSARAARADAAVESNRLARQGSRVAGAQRVAVAASGLQLRGTPLDVMANTRAETQTDVLTALYGGQRRAIGFENQAAVERATASSARRAGFLNAGQSLLTGAANIGFRQ